MPAVSLSRFLVDEQWQKHAIASGLRLLVAVFLGSRNEVEVATRYHAG